MENLSLEAKHLLRLMQSRGGDFSPTMAKTCKAMDELAHAGLVKRTGASTWAVTDVSYDSNLTKW